MDQQLEREFRHLLEGEQERLKETLANLNRNLSQSQKDSIQELSSYDQHSTDLGSETFERSKDVGLRDNARLELAMVHEAMERLDDGTYGICEGCGKPIDLDRLRAMPASTTCIRCKELAEEQVERRRPVEEEVLSPPFHRTFTDGQDSVIYDGEDAWQDLASYGTANSPQDVPDALDYEDAYIDADEAQGLVTRMDGIEDLGEGVTDLDAIYPPPKLSKEKPRHD
ncbi:MAG: TraR/DksA C4-type zinc finger protein [Limnochordia bacterium]|jgi:YteA family regulatory protein